ncbi:MAG: hypothetical protein KF869_15320 [Phycisphaeraceae bacterium]|nr:hypothetical protein [Phycisphaeraceae bacterium]
MARQIKRADRFGHSKRPAGSSGKSHARRDGSGTTPAGTTPASDPEELAFDSLLPLADKVIQTRMRSDHSAILTKAATLKPQSGVTDATRLLAFRDAAEAVEASIHALSASDVEGSENWDRLLFAADSLLWSRHQFRKLRPARVGKWGNERLEESVHRLMWPCVDIAEKVGANSGPFRAIVEGINSPQSDGEARSIINKIRRTLAHRKATDEGQASPSNRSVRRSPGPNDRARSSFPFSDDDLTLLAELAGRDKLTKVTELDRTSGMPKYDRMNDRLRAMASADPPLVERPSGVRSGYRITEPGRDELARRGMTPT